MAHFSHLSLTDRVKIQKLLCGNNNLNFIAKALNRDRRTIVREVLANRISVYHGSPGKPANNCAKNKVCKRTGLCNRCLSLRKICHLCVQCNDVCPDYEPAHCKRLEHPPFCCNGCVKINNCTIRRYYYDAQKAHIKSGARLHDTRSGICLTTAELEATDRIVSPLILKGQSIHHIYLGHKDELFCSEKTLYSLIDSGLLSIRNMDLSRKVRRKLPRRKREFKVDRNCRQNRTFEDYMKFLTEHPDIAVTQMDSVLPCQEGSKVFLTLFWPQAQFLLVFLREHNTARSVTDIFDWLNALLGPDTFMRLFPVILTDNGSEFSNPNALEQSSRTRVFFCDPLQSNQKSQIERSHEFIRAILPKGSSFDALTQKQCNLISSHINSYRRDSLQGKSPYEAFAWLYGKDILDALGIPKIATDEVTLTPRLLSQ